MFDMAEDLLYLGQILYTDGHALVTTDGTSSDVIAGDRNNWGYIEGKSDLGMLQTKANLMSQTNSLTFPKTEECSALKQNITGFMS